MPEKKGKWPAATSLIGGLMQIALERQVQRHSERVKVGLRERTAHEVLVRRSQAEAEAVVYEGIVVNARAFARTQELMVFVVKTESEAVGEVYHRAELEVSRPTGNLVVLELAV